MAKAVVRVDLERAGVRPAVDAITGEPAPFVVPIFVTRPNPWLFFFLLGPIGPPLVYLAGVTAEVGIPMSAATVTSFRATQCHARLAIGAGTAGVALAVVSHTPAWAVAGVVLVISGIVMRAVNRGRRLPAASLDRRGGTIELIGVHPNYAAAVRELQRGPREDTPAP